VPDSSSTSLSPGDVSLLVVEDEPVLRSALATLLTGNGYEVLTAATGREALHLAEARQPDVVLLDLGLPDLDGLDVCRHLRRWSHNPIIVLTADGAEDRKVAALDVGADDYVTKPFSIPELLARVRVALRHRRVIAGVVDDERLEVGDLRIDIAAHEAFAGTSRLDLSPKEFTLLTVLARNAGKVMTHRALLAQVWHDEAGGSQRLRPHVTLLRKKLGHGPRRPEIVTETAIGYRLLGPAGDDVDNPADLVDA
jgi:two-component system KDP operon response regulator KdpE